jgi:hypothetical protein
MIHYARSGMRIIERLRIAHTLALPQNYLTGTDPAGRRAPMTERILQPLRANLDWRSPALAITML